MPLILWDASALAKRYVPEIGTEAVDAVFEHVPASDMAATVLGYVETYSIILRKHNRGEISSATFLTVKTALREDIVYDPVFTLLSVDDAALFAGVVLMDRHALNSSDAGILALFLRYAHAQAPGSPPCLLVAADQRLLPATRTEGLATLDPEQTAPADIPALLAALVPGDEDR